MKKNVTPHAPANFSSRHEPDSTTWETAKWGARYFSRMCSPNTSTAATHRMPVRLGSRDRPVGRPVAGGSVWLESTTGRGTVVTIVMSLLAHAGPPDRTRPGGHGHAQVALVTNSAEPPAVSRTVKPA